MKPFSKKRAAEMRRYTTLRFAFLTQHPWCQFPLRPMVDGLYRIDAGCDQRATEVHHKRGRVGGDLLDIDHWAGLCHAHHVWVTEHPAEAIRLGISERRVGVR